jgi:hypothetical protein
MSTHRYSIVGQKHRGFDSHLTGIPAGTSVVLIREPDNPYDPSAIAVWIGGNHVGYLPGKGDLNKDLARYIDAKGRASDQKGLALDAKFVRSPNTAYPQVEVDLQTPERPAQ